ncbi:unnamed protein product [Schistocephalus solidus]|uniref:Secreted protein n=1 Tax=Schistocephalus solidus TaxID=70667 RepID=A0A0X3PQ04_SCHSO|nr:unnamed protein product [Schistocephalus solidus]
MLSEHALCLAVCIAVVASYPQRDGPWMREQDHPGLYFQKPQEFGEYPHYPGNEMHQFRPVDERFYGSGPHYMRPEPEFMERPYFHHPHQGPFPYEHWRGEPERFDHYGRGPMSHRFPGFQGFRGFREPSFQHFQKPVGDYELGLPKRAMDSAEKATKTAEASDLKKM